VKRPQAQLFDHLASSDQLYVYPKESLEQLNALVLKKGRVLDLGCGDGVIGSAFDSSTVVGVDVSFRCARLSRDKGLHALVGDATESLPFSGACFDTVYCVDVLHHLEQKWESIFGELDRVLRPGGVMAIVEPDARNPFVRWTQAPASPIRVAPFDNEPAIYPDELAPHLLGRGYEIACSKIHIRGEQVERGVFPLWQRAAKAPFTLFLAYWYRRIPNKFAMIAHKPCP
jgi:SAM-dependent methyltransferase